MYNYEAEDEDSSWMGSEVSSDNDIGAEELFVLRRNGSQKIGLDRYVNASKVFGNPNVAMRLITLL